MPRFLQVLVLLILLILNRPVDAQEHPGPRDHLALVYDSDRDQVVLFGGNDVDEEGNYTWNPTTWEWGEHGWTEVDPGTPGTISSMSSVFDPGTGTALSVGGMNPSKGDLDETWQWDGHSWTLNEGQTPGIRMSSGLAFDPVRNEVVLFSGCVGRDYPSDTWVFSAGSWARRSDDGPPGVCRPAMFFDAVRGHVVLFGGALSDRGRSDAMWEWDGESWSEVDQGLVRPTGRANMSMVWDEHRNRAVLFGGASADGVQHDLWEWDGERWFLIPARDDGPGPREVYGMVYHTRMERVLLYGGRTAFAAPQRDFWSWDGEQWAQIED